MSRLSVAFISAVVAVLVLALLPWTVTSERVTGAVVRRLKQEYGLDLEVRGRTTIALLPVPRLKLEDIAVRDGDGRFSATAPRLKVELRPVAFAMMHLRIAELSVAGAKASVTIGSGELAAADAMLAALKGGSDRDATSRIERVVVTGSTIEVKGQDGGGAARLDNLGATLHWPDPTGDLDISASADWNGETIKLAVSGLNPLALVEGRSDAFKAALSTRLGVVSGVGDLSWRAGPRFSGLLNAETPSLGELTRWTETGLDLQDFERPVLITGEGTIGTEGVEWPRAIISLGRDKLEGSLGYRLDRDRPQFRATLAGDSLDLGWLLPIADPTLADPPRSDYDVRLSASDLQLGPVRLRDAATGILVNGEKLEVSLARASIAGGSVRGRLTASLDGEGRDIKGQISVDRIELGRLLATLGAGPTATGTIGGQAVFDLTGDRKPDIASSLRGRATVTASNGEIAGLPITDPQRRPDEAQLPDRRAARTRFTRATVAIEFGRGMAEITEAAVETTSGRTQLQGRISLQDGTASFRTTTRPLAEPDAKPAVVLDLRGHLGRLAISAVAGEPQAAVAP